MSSSRQRQCQRQRQHQRQRRQRWRTALLVVSMAGLLVGPVPAGQTVEQAAAPTVMPSPKLDVRIEQPAAELTPGGRVVYQVRVRNHSARDLPKAVLHQLVPPVFAFDSAQPAPDATESGQVRWVLSVPAGEEVELTVRGNVHSKVQHDLATAVGFGARPRLATTACIAPAPHAVIAGCTTIVAEAGSWWLAPKVLLGFGILVGAVVGGYVWVRRRPSAR